MLLQGRTEVTFSYEYRKINNGRKFSDGTKVVEKICALYNKSYRSACKSNGHKNLSIAFQEKIRSHYSLEFSESPEDYTEERQKKIRRLGRGF